MQLFFNTITLKFFNLLLIGYLLNDIDYLDDDNDFPIWRYSYKPLETRYVAEVIHFKKYDTNLLCMRNPSIYNINAFFWLINCAYHMKKTFCVICTGNGNFQKQKSLNFTLTKQSIQSLSEHCFSKRCCIQCFKINILP